MVAVAGAVGDGVGAASGSDGSDRSDAALITDMNLVLRLAALGREARARQDLKLRQPLARATVAVRSVAEEAALGRLGGHLLEELNVKALEVVRDGGSLVTYSLRPVLPKLGPRFGKAMGAVRAALAAVDAAAAAVTLAAGEPLTLTVHSRDREAPLIDGPRAVSRFHRQSRRMESGNQRAGRGYDAPLLAAIAGRLARAGPAAPPPAPSGPQEPQEPAPRRPAPRPARGDLAAPRIEARR